MIILDSSNGTWIVIIDKDMRAINHWSIVYAKHIILRILVHVLVSLIKNVVWCNKYEIKLFLYKKDFNNLVMKFNETANITETVNMLCW